MATSPIYSWPEPDDTSLVKDGALAMRNLGNAIDTTMATMVAKTIVDAKGDIIAATAADTVARLPVGTNGQALKANSATATGLEWGSVAATKTYSLLGTGTLTSGSTVTVSGISGIDSIRVIINGASSTNTSATVSLRMNGDTANNYRNVYVSVSGTGAYTPQFLSSSSAAASSIMTGGMNDAAGATDTVNGYAQIDGCNTAGIKMVQGAASGGNVLGNNSYGRFYGGFWDNASTVTSVSLTLTAGTFDAGTFSVYGAA